MSDEQKSKNTVVISIRADEEFKNQIAQESELRGQTVSEAAERMLRLGLPLYLKRVPKKFERVETV